MQLKKKMEGVKRSAALLLILGLLLPSPAYSARPVGIKAGRSELRTQLENDLLAQGGILRSEARSSVLPWMDFNLQSLDQELSPNLTKFGLKIEKIQYVPLHSTQGKPFQSLKSRLAFAIIQSQAIAGAGYSGVTEGKEKDQVSILKKELDANAVSVGAESLRELAEFYDVRIIVIGNEGATRDQAAAIPNLKIYNQGGRNGTVLFLNDSVEGTNYVLKGQPGGWAIIALLDENNSYSTDGYRDTVSYRAKRDAGIDPVIRRENTVEKIFTQIAKANDQELKAWARDKHVVILGDRKRHEAAIAQLEALKKTSGLAYETVADGDFAPRTLQAAFGMRNSDGREVLVIGAGGANEHKMSLVAAYLSKPDEEGRKGFAASRYITHEGLKDSMENADKFSQAELEEFKSLNSEIDRQTLPVGKVADPFTVQTQDSIQGKTVVAGTAVTGARPVDLDLYRNELPAVSMIRTQEKAGQVVTNSFAIDEDGTPYLIRAVYQTPDLLYTRLTILSNNPFRPEKTMIYSNAERILSVIEDLETYPMTFTIQEMIQVIKSFDLMLQNLRTLDHFLQLGDQNRLASELADLQGLFQKADVEHFRSKAEDVRQEFLRVARGVGEQVVGVPSVTIDGVRQPLIQSVRSEARAKKPSLRKQLQDIAKRMVPPDGGILAADESTGSAGKRLESVGLENTYENRQRMRELMLTVPGQETAGINSVILYKETFDNVDRDGRNLVQHHLVARGILPGIKTDEGLKPDTQSPYPSVPAVAATATTPAIAAIPGEDIPNPKGLEGLPNMLATYKARGAVFTKWRTTQIIDTVRGLPTDDNIRRNAAVQAKQAKLTQEAGLVPIVEPEVLLDGDHDIASSYKATTRTLQIVFEALIKEGVWLDGVILKTSMILSGNKAASRADSETVGYETLKGLLKTVPAEVPAIVFLSGGQGDDEVVQNLDAVIRAAQTRFSAARDEAAGELKAEGNKKTAAKLRKLKETPWQISYSFGRGLQRPGLKVWKGQDENFKAAQDALLQAALATQAARLGQLKSFRSEARTIKDFYIHTIQEAIARAEKERENYPDSTFFFNEALNHLNAFLEELKSKKEEDLPAEEAPWEEILRKFFIEDRGDVKAMGYARSASLDAIRELKINFPRARAEARTTAKELNAKEIEKMLRPPFLAYLNQQGPEIPLQVTKESPERYTVILDLRISDETEQFRDTQKVFLSNLALWPAYDSSSWQKETHPDGGFYRYRFTIARENFQVEEDPDSGKPAVTVDGKRTVIQTGEDLIQALKPLNIRVTLLDINPDLADLHHQKGTHSQTVRVNLRSAASLQAGVKDMLHPRAEVRRKEKTAESIAGFSGFAGDTEIGTRPGLTPDGNISQLASRIKPTEGVGVEPLSRIGNPGSQPGPYTDTVSPSAIADRLTRDQGTLGFTISQPENKYKSIPSRAEVRKFPISGHIQNLNLNSLAQLTNRLGDAAKILNISGSEITLPINPTDQDRQQEIVVALGTRGGVSIYPGVVVKPEEPLLGREIRDFSRNFGVTEEDVKVEITSLLQEIQPQIQDPVLGAILAILQGRSEARADQMADSRLQMAGKERAEVRRKEKTAESIAGSSGFAGDTASHTTLRADSVETRKHATTSFDKDQASGGRGSRTQPLKGSRVSTESAYRDGIALRPTDSLTRDQGTVEFTISQLNNKYKSISNRAEVSQVELPRYTLPKFDASRRSRIVAPLNGGKLDEAYLFDREFALAEGGLALIRAAFGNNPAVVLVENDKDKAFVEQYNRETLAPQGFDPIFPAYTVKEANQKLDEEIQKKISELGGVRPGAFAKLAVVSSNSKLADPVLLRQQLQNIPYVVVTPPVFDQLAQGTGVSREIINLLQQAYHRALAQSA